MKKLVNGKEITLTAEEEAEVHTRRAASLAEAPKREAKEAINTLEASLTPRRLREAILTDEGKVWLQDTDNQITELRKQILPFTKGEG